MLPIKILSFAVSTISEPTVFGATESFSFQVMPPSSDRQTPHQSVRIITFLLKGEILTDVTRAPEDLAQMRVGSRTKSGVITSRGVQLAPLLGVTQTPPSH